MHIAKENILDEFYEKLRKEGILKTKLESRARKSETDIATGQVLSRAEIEKKTANLGH
jgi:hypothetical protein